MIMIELLIPILGIVGILAVCDLICLLVDGTRIMRGNFLKVAETLSVFFAPFLFLMTMDAGQINDCCSESAFFSPAHRASMYVLIVVCEITYFYSAYRLRLASPLIELIVTCFLLIGVVLNVFIAIHANDAFWLIGNVPIIAFFLSMLLQNHRFLIAEMENWDVSRMNVVEKFSLSILRSGFFIKYPVILIFCLPLLVLLAAILFVFGQKPDSMIRAFTETYRHGFSQLDYMCDNVQCGGHYLCSVAANGHTKIVKPIRVGERHGNKIICNRQLLISNAFEELIEQKFPRLHVVIRKNYDKVGDIVHRFGNIFNNKYFADFIYILMKPLEWIFLVVLYIADKKPENRIAQQYLRRSDRLKIESKNQENFF